MGRSLLLLSLAALASCTRPLTLEQAGQRAARARNQRYYTPALFKHR